MPSLAKHNYVSCLMQITLPEIDNYTLYYETFVFILRVYVIMLFDYVYRCTQSSARAICTLENNYKPANERYAKRGKVEKEKKKEDDIRERVHSHTYRDGQAATITTSLRQGKTVIVRSPRPNRIKSSFARACVASV